MIKLLFVEDDAQLLYMVRSGLEDLIGGYEILTAVNGKEGFQQWKEQMPDIIVSDIEMPVMNGFEMVSKIRQTDGRTPIIFATGLLSPKDLIHGYQVGVNNYIKKPYTSEEIDAHIKALLRTRNSEQAKDTTSQFTLGGFRFDASKSELHDKNGKTISLGPRETQILQLLCEHRNETVRRKAILERFWPEADYFTSRSLDVFIAQLRKRFAGDDGVSLVTVRGVGLKLTY
ncbi:response regulator transcription factor [Tannerella sp.]|uniref:response regulator transcription factor n=1 Tax=Tannerella sp. TaxID=2382127 RepID=UPI0026DAB137|nr:response regulator transcription factor [Tannerella sp.]MDO4702415.1 response regulator transcription factor [Tannerella sp.]